MIIVKLFVLFACINVLSALQTYCDIPGPSEACNSYDSTSLLTKHEIRELVHRINERRNFIALGHSKILPQAANMKKIRWSTELATFAQRWADQCDQSINPEREDECRDLESIKVGQAISSVVGPSPGLNIKSFIDIWFMQMLEYSGNVSFYNQSKDNTTKYLTQLIWAETELVGCGKVKFHVEKQQVILERLICNFAPKGNIHGKPVYAIGYAATQCADNMKADDYYKGLCDYEDSKLGTIRKLTDNIPTERSLLRILNLSNDSVIGEVDYPQKNTKQSHWKRIRQRSQKTRHILPSRHGTEKRTSMRKQNYRTSFVHNMSKNVDNQYNHQHQNGHSRLYQGYDESHIQKPSPRPIDPATYYFQRNKNHNFRKYDFVTPVYYYTSSSNYRKFIPRCTRKSQMERKKYCSSHHCINSHHCCHQTIKQQSEIFTNSIIPYHSCPCSTSVAKCLSKNPDISTTTNSYQMKLMTYMPNMMRSGNHKIAEKIILSKEDFEQYHEPKHSKINKIVHVGKDSYESPEDIYDESSHSNFNDYIYRVFNPSLRRKREHIDDVTLKPFWKLNELAYKETPATIIMRYTTLPNIKTRKRARNGRKPGKVLFESTESITMKPEKLYPIKQIYDEIDDEVQTTEKYLSFDELMYLRKFSDSYMDYNLKRLGGRRLAQNNNKTTKSNKQTVQTTKTVKATTTVKKATTKAKTTPPKTITSGKAPSSLVNEYTANTQFERRKHCTRRLTCTWTAFTGIADDINRIKEFGSRTPPGYVDGCTRTSTCTRDFMDRNKMATSSSVTDVENHGSISEDEEYCDRRSLDINKRNSDKQALKPMPKLNTGNKMLPIFNIANISENNPADLASINKMTSKRRKRMPSNLLTYGDLYYKTLNKLIKGDQDALHKIKKCPCNSATVYSKFPFLLCLFCHLMDEMA